MSSPSRTIHEEDLSAFLSGSFLPSPPEILYKINQASSDLDQIAKIINTDIGLCASVLKTINSPFYGMKNTIFSIPQAVTLLGLESVMNIINAHLLLTELKADKYNSNLDDFWQLSNEVAEACITVAKYLNFPATDEIYLLGLFHNAGIPMMLKRFPEYMTTIQRAYEDPELRITDTENKTHNCNHAIVGYLIAKSWQLPQHVRQIIRDHHNLDRLTTSLQEDSDLNMMLVILKIAEHTSCAYKILGKNDSDYEWEKIKSPILEYLGYSEPDFESLEDYVHETMGIFTD